MHKNWQKLGTIMLIGAILMVNSALVFATSEIERVNLEVGLDEHGHDHGHGHEHDHDHEHIDFEDTQQEFLDQFEAELNLTKTDYRQTLNSLADTKARLSLVEQEKLTLESQLDNITSLIDLTNKRLLVVEEAMIKKGNEVALLEENLALKEAEIEEQKEKLRSYIRLMHEQENEFYAFDEEGNIDTFKLLMADGTAAENIDGLQSLELLSIAGQEMLGELDFLRNQYLKSKAFLEQETLEMEQLRSMLVVERENLVVQEGSQAKLLEITLGQEVIYQQILERNLQQQENLIADIKHLSESLAFIEEKIESDGTNFDPSNYVDLIDERTLAVYEFSLDSVGYSSVGFIWPMEPTLGISAYFRNPDDGYEAVFGRQHNAIDLPAYQGSPVRAIEDAVVYAYNDNGYGYSSIILAHRDGFSSVYGHMTESFVTAGQVVAKGSIIGLSGGTPGTWGAGLSTTGAHLHLEILKDGQYVDPLYYLPLEVLTASQAKELPEKYYDDWEEASVKSSASGVSRFLE